MKLAVFGGTGKTGIPFVEAALAAGHDVTALARTPSKMTMQHPQLNVIQGDALRAEDVEKTIAGADAVVSLLGHTRGTPTPDNMQTVAMGLITEAMKRHGVRRLVSLTGAGVSAPQDQPKLPNHIISFLLKTISPKVLKDAQDHVAVIQRSGVDYVIVRGPMLTDAPRVGSYRVGWVGVNTGARIPRADLADFMLKQVTDNQFVGQMPMVST